MSPEKVTAQMDRLSTIEHALGRKRTALRSLTQRVHGRHLRLKRVWLRNAFKSQIHRSEFQTLVHRGLHQNTIYGRMDGVYQTNAREKAATSSFTVMNASSQPCPGSIQWLTKIKTKSLHNSIY